MLETLIRGYEKVFLDLTFTKMVAVTPRCLVVLR